MCCILLLLHSNIHGKFYSHICANDMSKKLLFSILTPMGLVQMKKISYEKLHLNKLEKVVMIFFWQAMIWLPSHIMDSIWNLKLKYPHPISLHLLKLMVYWSILEFNIKKATEIVSEVPAGVRWSEGSRGRVATLCPGMLLVTLTLAISGCVLAQDYCKITKEHTMCKYKVTCYANVPLTINAKRPSLHCLIHFYKRFIEKNLQRLVNSLYLEML